MQVIGLKNFLPEFKDMKIGKKRNLILTKPN